MGQVPKIYGIVGSGRVARHFSHYFQLKKIPFKTWSRKQNSSGEFASFVASCRVVLLLISDNVIEPFIRSQAEFLKDRKLVHFSGSLTTDLAQGFHPLMTFNDQGFYDLKTYEQISFISEKEGPHTFQQVFPELRNRSFMIPQAKKAYYHALCVMANNFTTVLWQKLLLDFESKLLVPRTAAFPLLEQTALNLKQNAETALTGPLARGDWKTVEKNLESLKGDSFYEIYESFYEFFGEGRAHQ